MKLNEIYEFLLKGSWKSGEINGGYTVEFIQSGANCFDIVLIQG